MHCALGQTVKRDIQWNPYQNLSDQLATLSHKTEIAETAISNESMSIRTFSVAGQPDE